MLEKLSVTCPLWYSIAHRNDDIESILYGDEYVTEEKIEQYCQEETIVRQSVARIGFI